MRTSTPEQELIGLERQFWQAMKDGDVQAAVDLTEFPCVVSGPQGVRAIDEETFAKMMEQTTYSLDRYAISDDATVNLVNDDLAVVGYQIHEECTVDGQPVQLDAAESSTWVRRDGKWRCVQHSESLNGDPFGRDRTGISARGAEDSEDTEDRGDGQERGTAEEQQIGAAEAAYEQREEQEEQEEPASPGKMAQPEVASAQPGGDEAAIRELVARWNRASEAHDVPTLMELTADDAVFQMPGEPPFGKEEFEAFSGGIRANRVSVEAADIEELKVIGDWAFTRTHLVVDVTPPGGQTTRRAGHALTLFCKDERGAWQLARDCNAMIGT
jgi:uncharacterized protein (TIGR02246 family)